MSHAAERADAMAALRAEITEGWTVRIIDHDYGSEGRDDVTVTRVREDGLILRPKRAWTSQDRRFTTMNFAWRDENQEVTGRTVYLYAVGTSITSRTMPGVRRLIKTFVFAPPREF